jgi:hypothetical protein
MNRRFNLDMQSPYDTSANRGNQAGSNRSNAGTRSRYKADTNEIGQASNAQVSPVSSTVSNANLSSIWEPRKYR